jgi:hypothetical protein
LSLAGAVVLVVWFIFRYGDPSNIPAIGCQDVEVSILMFVERMFRHIEVHFGVDQERRDPILVSFVKAKGEEDESSHLILV